jgi:hypothetical protein
MSLVTTGRIGGIAQNALLARSPQEETLKMLRRLMQVLTRRAVSAML